MSTVWVVTEENNDYDQYGAYFLEVYAAKPTVEQLQKDFNLTEAEATHLFNGGGRVKWEDNWRYLTEVELK